MLEYLLRNGSHMCVRIAESEVRPKLQELQTFESTSTDGQDMGLNVRMRCRPLAATGSVRASATGLECNPSPSVCPTTSPVCWGTDFKGIWCPQLPLMFRLAQLQFSHASHWIERPLAAFSAPGYVASINASTCTACRPQSFVGVGP